ITDPQWRNWLSRSLRGAIKQINTPEFKRKLLPPGYEDKGKKDDQ
ncbi:MAG: hypothetical protein GTO41_27895, partial [Burkholderiales bacterium]|nr:hypothetical protein [Burkholderiales bacterium]